MMGQLKMLANVRYKINSDQSQMTARVFAGGLLSVFGHDHTIALRDIAGEVLLTSGGIESASLRVTIKASSATETGKEFSDQDRQDIDRAVHEQALESANYPEIVFESTKISVEEAGEKQYRARTEGELVLHGVVHPIVIPARVTLNGDTLRAKGEFPVKHSDFKIKRLTAAAGAVKAKDEMKIAFDIVGRRV